MRIRKHLAALLALGLLLGLCPAAVTEDIGDEIASPAVDLAVPEEAVALGGGPEDAGCAGFVGDTAVAPAEGDIPVDAEHFTLSEYGSGFMIYVRDNIDRNGDGVLSEAERLDVKEIDFDFGSALDGLGYFPNLEKLTCNQVFDRLDVSGNPKLRELSVMRSGFERIDLSQNPALEKLILFDNALTALDVSQNPALTSLSVAQPGQKTGLTRLDVSHNPALKSLGFSRNSIAQIDLTHCPDLESLSCTHNGLTALDVSKNPKLKELACNDNAIEALDLSGMTALENVDCFDNRLKRLDLSGCKSLKTVYCGNNELTGCLDLAVSDALRTVSCVSNPLTGLKLPRSLKNLYCYDTSIAELNLYGCPTLIDLSGRTPSGKYYSKARWKKNYLCFATTSYELCVDEDVKLVQTEPTPEPTQKPTASPKPTATVGEAAYMFTDDTGTYEVIGTKVTFVKPAKSQKTVTVPDKVKTRGSKLKVTAIADKAFYKDRKLTTVTIGKYVKTIGAKAFYSCEKLKKVKGGAGVVTIGDGAFRYCVKLGAFTLYTKVRNIGAKAFYGCEGLKTLTIRTSKLTDKTVGAKAFDRIYAKVTFKCPKAKLKAYKKLLKKKGAPKKAQYK